MIKTTVISKGRSMFLATLLTGGVAANAQVYTTSDSWTVGNGDYILESGVPGCGVNTIDPIAEAANALAASRQGGIYGSLASVLQTALKIARPETQGAIGQLLDFIYGGDRFANCVPVSVAIPSGAQILPY